MNWQEYYSKGLAYQEFLSTYGTPQHQQRWQAVYDRVRLTDAQQALLAGFGREMHLLCLAGTWCGDCVREGPILQRITESSPKISLRFLASHAHKEVPPQPPTTAIPQLPPVLLRSDDSLH